MSKKKIAVIILGGVVGILSLAILLKSAPGSKSQVVTLALFESGQSRITDSIEAEKSLAFITSPLPSVGQEKYGLHAYFESLDVNNSEIYVVQKGDNLTRIGKQYGVSPGSIITANNLSKDTIWPGMKLKIMKDAWTILIDKSENVLFLHAGSRVVKQYPIATGKDNSTPEGEFKIVNRLVNPDWYYDGQRIPALDSENPLGTRWLGFNLESYGIHGTNDPDIIGQYATLGCIRMQNHDVEEIFELVSIGTSVRVIE